MSSELVVLLQQRAATSVSPAIAPLTSYMEQWHQTREQQALWGGRSWWRFLTPLGWASHPLYRLRLLKSTAAAPAINRKQSPTRKHMHLLLVQQALALTTRTVAARQPSCWTPASAAKAKGAASTTGCAKQCATVCSKPAAPAMETPVASATTAAALFRFHPMPKASTHLTWRRCRVDGLWRPTARQAPRCGRSW